MALLLGFGVLGLWSVVTTHRAGLPGWTAYRAAVLGDGICLPLLVGALAAAGARLESGRHDGSFTAAGAGLGAVIGVATQVSWLRSNTIGVNWTIPRQHHFNAAGWYHAGFLVTVLAVITAMAARLACRAYASRVTIPHLAVVTAAAVGFALLQTLDTVRPTFAAGPAGGQLIGLVTTGGLVILVLAAMQGPGLVARPRRWLVATASGCLVAVVLAWIALDWPQHPLTRFVAAAMLMTVVTAVLATRKDAAADSQRVEAG